jgi:hypothetical protein
LNVAETARTLLDGAQTKRPTHKQTGDGSMQDMDTTYRLVALGDSSNVGQTAATPQLAKLVPGNLYRESNRLGIERTDWVDHFGKPKVHRTILIEAESRPGEWKIGPDSCQP